MKKPVKIAIALDLKLIKRVFALLGLDIPSDEELEKRFFERELIVADLNDIPESGEAEFAFCVAFVSIILKVEEKEKS